MTLSTSIRITPFIGLLLISQFLFGQQELIHEPDYNRPVKFAHLSDTINCSAENIHLLFPKAKGESVAVLLAENFAFSGAVIARKVNSDSRTSIVIRSTNYSDYTLSLSRQVNPDGSETISGRIISFKHGDSFVLHFEKGVYKWIKKGFYELVNE